MPNTKTILAAVLSLLSIGTLEAAPLSQQIDSVAGPVALTCDQPGAWSFKMARKTLAAGADEITVSLASPREAPPPQFNLDFSVPQVDIHHVWQPLDEAFGLPPNWGVETMSQVASGLPVYDLVNDNDRSRLAIACSEVLRDVRFHAGVQEAGCRVAVRFRFFTAPEAPLTRYELKIRLDRQDAFYWDAVAAASRWMEAASGSRPCVPSPAAFDPLYSTWYGFHQDVHAAELEAECARAVALGMKTIIVDDGWQADNGGGYAFCGDWEVSKRRFPDLPAHVAKVHALGMKYMMWYSVPYIGLKSKNFARFQGKYLQDEDRGLGAAVLDPRFPEVRQFLVGVYEKALREWNLDGFKLDFIDSFSLRGKPDPAIAQNYAGRDIRSIPEAVDVLMADVSKRLRAIRPDILVEFRQRYVGPRIRQYGNMLRAADCPGDMRANRVRIANLRLISGGTAVHADMLEWSPEDTAESAARPVLNALFSVIQYSMRLDQLPPEHVRMVRHWIAFTTAHREALLKGAFRPRHPENSYPVIEAESAAERIVAVYGDVACADTGAPDRPVYLVNATGTGRLSVRFGAVPAKVEAFDTFGAPAPAPSVTVAGLQDVAVPVSGYLKVTW